MIIYYIIIIIFLFILILLKQNFYAQKEKINNLYDIINNINNNSNNMELFNINLDDNNDKQAILNFVSLAKGNDITLSNILLTGDLTVNGKINNENNKNTINQLNTKIDNVNTQLNNINNQLNSKIDNINNQLNGKIDNVNNQIRNELNNYIKYNDRIKMKLAENNYFLVNQSWANFVPNGNQYLNIIR